MSTLDDAFARFNRAQEHLATLHAETAAFLAADGYKISIEPSLKGQTYRCSVFGVRAKPVGGAWPLLIGEFLYNLRACLDYIAGGLNGRNFPIDASCQEYFAMNARGSFVGGFAQTLGMGGPIQAAIEALQPYNVTPITPRADPLWLLEALRNIDTHGHLHVIAGAITDSAWRVVPSGAIADGKITIPQSALGDRTEILRFKGRMLPEYDPARVKVEFNTTTHVVFGPGQAGEGQDVIELLEKISARVRGVAEALKEV